MGSIFLSGGGDKEQTKIIDQKFVEQIEKEKPMLYIPIAMNPSRFEGCFEWINSVFKPLGIKVEMWTDLANKSLDDMRQFSSVYIGGGNTFSLLKDIRLSGFDAVLRDYIENNGIVYGGSAGAIILGADIMTCAHMDPNDVNLENCDGVNLINNYSIWCHYQENNDDLIRNYIKNYRKKVIALPEDSGVLFTNKKIEIIGSSPAYFFENDNKMEVKPESSI
jgi:dipeptidase E